MTFFSYRFYFVCLYTVLNLIFNIINYDHFLDQKPVFHNKTFFLFSQFVLYLTSNNSTSQNIGGTNAWAVPHGLLDNRIDYKRQNLRCPWSQ